MDKNCDNSLVPKDSLIILTQLKEEFGQRRYRRISDICRDNLIFLVGPTHTHTRAVFGYCSTGLFPFVPPPSCFSPLLPFSFFSFPLFSACITLVRWCTYSRDILHYQGELTASARRKRRREKKRKEKKNGALFSSGESRIRSFKAAFTLARIVVGLLFQLLSVTWLPDRNYLIIIRR